MLEKLPHAIGQALQGIRPGLDRTVFHGEAFAGVPATIEVTSPAFGDGEMLPERFTEDGDALSPPLAWTKVPPDAQAVVLLVEDADSPTPAPLVHAIVWSLPGGDGWLPEGALPGDGAPADDSAMGRNSYLQTDYLPPDPPPGHGPHRYLFQIFALSGPLDLSGHPGRGALVDAMAGRVLAKGALTGIYARE